MAAKKKEFLWRKKGKGYQGKTLHTKIKKRAESISIMENNIT